MIGIITRAVRHLAITTFANDWWQRPKTPSELFDWQVRYLDICQFYVYGLSSSVIIAVLSHTAELTCASGEE